MGNPYFQFKQFKVFQEHTAMKVTTEACLFGAFVARHFQAQHVLDIGAGTGLLSLIYAQHAPTSDITAVELDPSAARQAQSNFENSPWAPHLHLVEADIKAFQTEKKIDLIVSNPPFYQSDLRSENKQRNLAHHDTGLLLKDLVVVCDRLSKENTKVCILLPVGRVEEVEQLFADLHWFLVQKIGIRSSNEHPIFRYFLVFSKIKPLAIDLGEISIRHSKRDLNYTPVFVDLLKDLYLFL